MKISLVKSIEIWDFETHVGAVTLVHDVWLRELFPVGIHRVGQRLGQAIGCRALGEFDRVGWNKI